MEYNKYNDESEDQLVKSNIISMMFTDLYYELGAPDVDELAPFGIDEKEFENPTMETIEKLNNYGLTVIKRK